MPSWRGDPLGGGLVVAGEHDDFDAGLVQGRDGGGRGFPRGVGQGDHRRGACRRRRRARRCVRWRPGHHGPRPARPGRCLRSAMSLRLPTRIRRPSTVAPAPWPGTFRKSEAARTGAPCSRACRTTAAASGCSDSCSTAATSARSSFSLDSVDDDVGHFRFALGQGAGLVHHHGVDPGGGFQGGGVLEQDASFGAQSGADHDGRRCGQAQRVGAGDDHDGDGEQQGGLDSGAEGEPGGEGHGSADEGDQDQPERGPVGQPLARGPWSSGPPGRGRRSGPGRCRRRPWWRGPASCRWC